MNSEEPEYIELNLANYDAGDVEKLNAWGVWAVGEIDRLRDEVSQLKTVVAHGKRKRTLLRKALREFGRAQMAQIAEWEQSVFEREMKMIRAKNEGKTGE